MKYHIVQVNREGEEEFLDTYGLQSLASAVNVYIEQGWKPIGGISIHEQEYVKFPANGMGNPYKETQTCYVQAVVKDDAIEEKLGEI